MMTRLLIIAAILASLVITGFLFSNRVGQQTPEPVDVQVTEQAIQTETITSQEIEITSGELGYPAYYVRPASTDPAPAVVLLHSINGLDPGYRQISDRLADAGYAVLALQWQAHARVPHDDVVIQLVRDSIAFLQEQPHVDSNQLGLTGFCIGGRYAMLLLPQIKELKAGVAWYGFPYRGGDENQVTAPADLLSQLGAPMLIIHGTKDNPSPVADIYRYATELDAAGKYFEMKIYQGEPHGFMLASGQLAQSFAATDALQQMISFFDRTLK